ncbi:class I SAM-dependent methyltransferase [Arenibaculum sp.]|uniref:class I SAM-dependent methyltransferase n=1 Tax=Arenibaculum sp. TaxID=2865862 RepID=UPI002E0E5550|nr:class I SAM-dependent methyltransferase [Arenibaculum sp.]
MDADATSTGATADAGPAGDPELAPHLLDYLDHVGIRAGVSYAEVACEICGGTDFAVLCETVDIGRDRRGRLPVTGCRDCGFVMQNPRFNPEFYEEYYNRFYRSHLFGSAEPEKAFIVDQIRRGEALLASLAPWLAPEPGHLLDVGSSAGGLMVPFARRGWTVLGSDPDLGYVEFGRRRLGLDILPVAAEDMELPQAQFDLVIITGSLEHVFDVNRVMQVCRRAAKPGSLLLIEGRAYGYGLLNGFFSHSHRRYLTQASIRLLMAKHGWTPLWATADPICGPTRPGGVYCLGRAAEPADADTLAALVRDGAGDGIDRLIAETEALRGAAP